MIHIVMLKLLSFVFIKKFLIRMIMIIVIIIVTCKQRKCHITQWIISKDLNPKLLRYNFLSYSAPYLKSFNYPTASYFTNLFIFQTTVALRAKDSKRMKLSSTLHVPNAFVRVTMNSNVDRYVPGKTKESPALMMKCNNPSPHQFLKNHIASVWYINASKEVSQQIHFTTL